MNKLQRRLGIGLLALGLLAGCREYKREYSEIKHEDAVVSKMNYTKGHNNLEIVWKFYEERLELRNVYHPEKNEIAFDGKVDFELDDRIIFDRFEKVGDSADVSYKEIHWKTYNYDGKTRYLEKDDIQGYEFVDAVRSKNE